MELFRRQVVVLVTLFGAKEPVSGLVLSQKSGLSLNTLKKEIDEVNRSCFEHGFEILSKTGSGYEISILDRQKYFRYRNEIISRYHRNLFFFDSQTDRVHYIIRHMLAHENLFVDDIAEECFCSVSTINRDMKDVKQRLERNGLKLVNHTNRGMMLEGREWDIRLALLNEYQIYREFETTYHYQEDTFEKQFLAGTAARMSIDEAVKGVLDQYHYPISYNVIRDLSSLFALTVTRHRYLPGLKKDSAVFTGIDTRLESEIVDQILSRLSRQQQVDLDALEKKTLAAYIRANRILTHARLEREGEKEEALAYADGFIAHMKSVMDIGRTETAGLRQDLACGLLMLKRKGELNIHTTHAEIATFGRDGLMTLDHCALLYFWLKENTAIACRERDVMSLYYIFAIFNKERRRAFRKRILVVSRYGIYAARAMAYEFERLSNTTDIIEFIPCEYLNIRHFDLNEIDCIATDIEDLQKEFPAKQTAFVYYFRREHQAREFVKRTILPRERFREEIFTEKDVIYADRLRDMKSVEKLIREEVLLPEEDADAYLKELRKKNEVYTPSRQNQVMVLNTLRDVLGRDFFKIVILKKPGKINDSMTSLLVIYNTKDRELEKTSYMNERIVPLLHADGLMFSMDPGEDYETLVRLMYGA